VALDCVAERAWALSRRRLEVRAAPPTPLTEQPVQDRAFEAGELGGAAPARPGHRHLQVERDPAGADHHNPVGEGDRLGDIRRDQNGGEFLGEPDAFLVEE